MQKFALHSASVCDVDWKTNEIFASCSMDSVIQVCQVGSWKPSQTLKVMKCRMNDGRNNLQYLKVHQGPVYSIRWNLEGEILASASGDKTVKVKVVYSFIFTFTFFAFSFVNT